MKVGCSDLRRSVSGSCHFGSVLACGQNLAGKDGRAVEACMNVGNK